MESDKIEVLLLGTEPRTKEHVGSALQLADEFKMGSIFHDFSSLVDQLEVRAAPVVLVDIDADPIEMLGRLQSIVSDFADTRFVVLTSEMDGDLVLRSMQAGIRHIQKKDTIGTELVQSLSRLGVAHSSESGERGSVVTVLSASGGCGATTLVVNLAEEIQNQNSAPVLLVDLDTHYGAVASYLGLKGRFGISDVLGHSGRVDAQLIRSTATQHSENLHVLLSPATVDFLDPKPLDVEAVNQVIGACRAAYKFTLIDAPRHSARLAAKLAGASDRTFIVLQMTIKDMNQTRNILSALARNSNSDGRVTPVLNRFRKSRNMLGLKDARKVLGDHSLVCLSNDFKNAIRAVNYGEPLAKIAPRSALRKELVKLAGELCRQSSTHQQNGKG